MQNKIGQSSIAARYELILDLHGCDVYKFTRNSMDTYFHKICEATDMERCALKMHFWDEDSDIQSQQPASYKRASAVQFTFEGSIIVHTMKHLGDICVNIFSCNDFNEYLAGNITVAWFGARFDYGARFIARAVGGKFSLSLPTE